MAKIKKILIIDDDRINQKILSQSLKNKGYDVLSLFDPRQCFEQIVGYKPDLILLDILMPGLNGFDLLKMMKEKSIIPGIPVIVLTALSQEANVDQVLELGAEEYWLKTDYDTSQLAEKISKKLDSNK